MNHQTIKTENDLANFIIKELQGDGWVCYEEVRIHRGGQIADIVAVKNNYIRVIETKMSNTLALIEQAQYWTFYAHSVFVASYRFKGWKNGKHVGYKNPNGTWAFQTLCKHLGIGILTVIERATIYNTSFEVNEIPSRFNRKILLNIKQILCDEMLAKGNAGTKGGGYWTPFKKTCESLLKVVNKHSGIELKDAIKEIKHHYSKDSVAVACLAKGIREGIIPNIGIATVDRKIYLFPES